MAAARILVLLFVTAVAVNYPWELAQAPLYAWPGESRNSLWHCFVASLGDGLLVLGVFSAGWLALGRRDWFEKPGLHGYLVMLAVGLAIGLSVEWAGVHLAQRWAYTDLMPRMPGLEIGVVPVLQMLFLPPLIFRIVAAIPKRHGVSGRTGNT